MAITSLVPRGHPATSSSPSEAHLANILIVDDLAVSRDVLGAILATRGHHLARDTHPDLVITDVLMPTMDGYEFVRQLRLDPEIGATPVVFYTAYYLEHDAQRLAHSCGVSHILTKRSDPDPVLVGDAGRAVHRGHR